MPWNGRHDVLIDRFDARAVLDMVPLSPKVFAAPFPAAVALLLSSFVVAAGRPPAASGTA